VKEAREIAPGREARLHEAAGWIVQLEDPDSPAAVRKAFEAWCAASPEHRRAFEELQALWQTSCGIQEAPIAPAEIADDPYRGQVPIETWHRARARRPQPASLRRLFGTKRLAAVAAAAGVLAVLVGALFLVRHSAGGGAQPADLAIATEPGVNREVRLPDGSLVTVAGGSRLAARFTPQARTVVLERGEAFFQVERDRNRPFTVDALDTRVTAIGTAFNVRADQDIVRVAVTEGAVSVDRGSPLVPRLRSRPREVIRLAAGHQVTLARSQPDPIVVTVDAASATAWLSGKLKFVDEPLSSVVAAINRYAAKPVSLDDEALGGYRFTGTVHARGIDDWLRGLPDIFPVEVIERAGGAAVVARSDDNTTSRSERSPSSDRSMQPGEHAPH
jgi:transmembrane sensor